MAALRRGAGLMPWAFSTRAIRLAGAVLIDVHDEWQAAERGYFSEASMAKLAERDDDPAVVGELAPAD